MLPLMYGVWIPKQGWLKANGAAVAFDNPIVARSTARRIGMGARIEYIDSSLAELEVNFLQLENNKKGIQEIINGLFRRVN